MHINKFAPLLFVLLSTGAAIAEEKGTNSAAFLFGGRYHTDHMEDLLNLRGPFGVDYEDNYVLGAGYQQFFVDGYGVKFGLEAGSAFRFGTDASVEGWAGVVGRYDGWVIGDKVRISPALTLGLSAISNPMGIEAEREADEGGNATLLFYIGPEINLSWADNPNTEVFFRVQHRSGAWGRMGDMGDGANASTVGMRWHW